MLTLADNQPLAENSQENLASVTYSSVPNKQRGDDGYHISIWYGDTSNMVSLEILVTCLILLQRILLVLFVLKGNLS